MAYSYTKLPCALGAPFSANKYLQKFRIMETSDVDLSKSYLSFNTQVTTVPNPLNSVGQPDPVGTIYPLALGNSAGDMSYSPCSFIKYCKFSSATKGTLTETQYINRLTETMKNYTLDDEQKQLQSYYGYGYDLNNFRLPESIFRPYNAVNGQPQITEALNAQMIIPLVDFMGGLANNILDFSKLGECLLDIELEYAANLIMPFKNVSNVG